MSESKHLFPPGYEITTKEEVVQVPILTKVEAWDDCEKVPQVEVKE